MTDLISRLRDDSYELPSCGNWIERDGSTLPNNSCSQAADEINRLRQQHAQAMTDMNAEIERLLADAERWRYINEHNNIWRRDDRENPCSLLCVVLPYGADLSCRATREAAIDAARAALKETP